jgi:Ca2+-binding EF-hand superfamily protein
LCFLTIFAENAEGVRFSEQFEWFDQDATGFISEGNFVEGIAKLGFTMTRNDVRTLMHKYDANFDGQIDYREFLEAFASGRDGQGMLRKVNVSFCFSRSEGFL